MKFKDKVALVTGSSSGIGKAIALRFLQEGATVCINGRHKETLLAAKEELSQLSGNQNVYCEVADCTNEQDLATFYQQIEAKFGYLDILVANIGDGRSTPDAISSQQHWAKVWDTNFNSALYSARQFLPLLSCERSSREGANILFISSIVAMEAFGAPVDYSTAKAAVNAFAKNLARKVAPDIRVNVIAPGNVYFEGGSWAEKIASDPQKVESMLQSSVPMQRFGTPEEIANAAAFLCSDEASFITGSTLVVDGGQTVSGF